MEELKKQIDTLKANWKIVFEKISESPELLEQHVPNCNPNMLDELINVIVMWFDRLRAPQGYAPAFHLSRGLVTSTLITANGIINKIIQGEYSGFQSLILRLTQILSGINVAISYSDKESKIEDADDLLGKLNEGIVLLSTAQKELEQKNNNVEKSVELANEINEIVGNIDSTLKKTDEYKTQTERIKSQTEELYKQADVRTNSISEMEEKIENIVDENGKLNSQLNNQLEKNSKLSEDLEENNRIINDLLPKGAAAGLSVSFAEKAKGQNLSKFIWGGIFLADIILLSLSLVLLIYFPELININIEPNVKLWESIIHKLPLTIPLVWLGWFSAIQYGNTIRLQEDYRFKEATAKAFAGFRDHMEHLASIELEDGNKAMTLLSVETIKVLSHEPQRIFGKTDTDAAPTKGIFDSLKNLKLWGKK